jgi:hypothetical protein
MSWDKVVKELEDTAIMLYQQLEVEDWAKALIHLIARLEAVTGQADFLEELKQALTRRLERGEW